MSRRAGLGLLAFLLGLTILRLWWCGRFELSPDEAYYWLWSQRLDWAYFSKGPGIALAIRAGTEILGDTERGVRWLSPLLMLGTTGLLWLLVRDALSRATATATAIALQCVPLACAGSLLMTIDPLSIFFWVLALLCAWRALSSAAGRTPAWWLACGAACGAGVVCKYTNALALAGIVVAALSRPGWRKTLRGRGVLGLALGFAPFVVPPLAWNARHGWPTASHLVHRGGLTRGESWFQPRETLEFVAAHFGTWSPLIFALLLAALPAILRRARAEPGPRFLMLASAPVLALYAALALHEAGEANWTGPGVLGLLPLAVDHWLARARASRGALVLAVSALATGALLSLAIANTNLVRALGVPLSARQDPSTRVRGWKDVARAAEDLHPGGPLVASHYGLASELAFYGSFEDPPGVPRTPAPRNQFWFWQDPSVPQPETFTLITDRPRVAEDLGAACEPLAEREIRGPGGVLRTIRLHRCVRSGR